MGMHINLTNDNIYKECEPNKDNYEFNMIL
jgi:hypothetical protein